MIESIIILVTLITFPIVALAMNRNGNSNNTSIRDFTLGKRKTTAFPIAAGISMSFVGGAATLNMASLGYQYGWSVAIDPFVVFVALVISVLLSKIIRAGKGVTISALLTDTSPKLKIILGITSFGVYQLLTAAQFVALGKLLSPYFPELSSSIIVSIPAILVFSYIYIRGFESVTNTDIFQFILIILLFAIPAIWVVGVGAIVRSTEVQAIPAAPLSLLVYLALPLFFVPVSQDTNIRIMAADTLRNARKGLIWGGVFYVFLVLTSISIGIFMNYEGYSVNNPESILPMFFTEYLSSFSIIATVAVLAAIISTLDSFAFDAIVSVSNDVIGSKSIHNTSPEKNIIALSSALVFVIALVIAIIYQQILGLILAGMLLYVSIFIPVALGRALKVNDSCLVVTTIITIVVIIACKFIEYTPPVEPVSFIFFHLFLLIPAKGLSKK